ncbi:VOC family protein [Granulicella mallensis]|jgi:predicted enzyme related to lactoylglutathione lyase|uniref:Glyoxalase/bleomycin resistance protein/dioxygenase n=1 Tax=Granulicella mallensis (strain ATCC BAA-1857 / DSM 23137 / MP5ACTX8) TaxID=682795 RepID=G8NZU9_GRAMM|nr:VOC family protein [Granulicella mallensis]AEU34576.1 Glyoxalase/bleomycin resistance protein/dioxygenase [Granulicella mallensis MP5ACTX8]
MSKFEGNAVTWFEIPATDMQRAVHFYETLLDKKLCAFPSAVPYFMFPAEQGAVAGALIHSPLQKPTADGTMVYLNVDGQLDATLGRANTLGTTVLVPRTEIPGGFGSYACLLDSEGNHIGLHSR